MLWVLPLGSLEQAQASALQGATPGPHKDGGIVNCTARAGAGQLGAGGAGRSASWAQGITLCIDRLAPRLSF